MVAEVETTRCVIVVNPNAASGKTRKRVKAGGPEFDVFHNGNRPGSILVRSPKTGWFGWLSLDEVSIENQRKAEDAKN